MTKHLFQDIIPPDKRSIKRVPVPDRLNRTNRADHVHATINDGIRKSEPTPAVTVRHLDVPDDENPERPESPATEQQRPGPSRSIPPPTDSYSHSTKYSTPLRRVPFYEENEPYRRRFPWKASLILICAAVVIIGTYLVLSHFAKAIVTLTPKIRNITINTELTGALETNISTSTATGTTITNLNNITSTQENIPYRVISVTKDGAMSVTASGQTAVATKAMGKITIFNDYSTVPQRLVANTRFATPSGLIYRIGSAINIPGKRGQTPGSITVTVTADKAGSQYNIGLSDFVIPGLSGTTEYKSVYARSQTPMTGGFLGTEPQIDPATLAATQATIEAELKGALLQQAEQAILPNEILLPNAYIIDYQHLASTENASSTNQAVVHDEGTIHAFVFNTSSLAQALITAASSTTSTSTLPSGIVWNLTKTSGLNFSLAISSSTVSAPWNLSSLPFKINGNTTLVAAINTEKIKENLLGKPKNDFDPILSSFPSVVTATMSMQPFWKQSFPNNPQNITISVNQP